jgi:tRNA/rRNA methyltransferase
MKMRETRPATKEELIGFFDNLEGALDESRFFWPPEKRPTMVRNLRNMFHRLQATEQDIKTLRGIVASLMRQRDGKQQGP